ncbi:MAG: SDR family NAD(P)-dependent oxidoreductase [Bacteroidota bacterium]
MTKNIFISGATSGIGKATAYEFAKQGHHLILTGRRAERLEEIKEDLIQKNGIKVHTLCFDVRDKDACATAFHSLPDTFKSIDILVNNAGLARGFDPIHEGKLDDWETMIDTNVKGLLYLTRLISPGMVERKSGHIINVCSTAGKEVYPKGNVYCASKHAVDALTKAMRIDLHTYGIKVSQVAPAHVEETEFAQVRFHGDEERAKIYNDFIPLNSKDVAEAIYFMASRPKHVCVQDILMMGTQQANSNFIDRSGR